MRQILLITLALLISNCANNHPTPDEASLRKLEDREYRSFMKVDVPASTNQIMSAAVYAGLNRDWSVVSRGDDSVVLYLHHRKEKLTLQLKAGEGEVLHRMVRIRLADKFDEQTGVTKIRNWLSNLRNDMKEKLIALSFEEDSAETGSAVASRLLRLDKLLQDGIITEPEHDAQRQKIISDI